MLYENSIAYARRHIILVNTFATQINLIYFHTNLNEPFSNQISTITKPDALVVR